MGLLSRFRDRRPVDLDARSPELGLKLGDMLVLQQLVEAGGDPRAPRHVIYYLYFDGEAAAEAAGQEASDGGFAVDVRSPDASGQWAVVCERHDYVLDPETVRDNSDFFDAIANRHAGEYDGWEASVN